MNPYEILNMTEDADFEALKARYEELKAVYGEERFLPGEEGAEGARKLTQLEDAWRIILDKKKVKDDEEKYGTGYAYVEEMVKANRYDDAQARLDAVSNRDGEWHYYQALVYYKREWLNDSLTHLEEAVRLSPDNVKYRDSLAKMKQVLGNSRIPPEDLGARPGVNGNAYAGGNCLNDCCTALCCAECLSMCCCR
ncbi:MAG: hypothetical protein E7350_01150 [Clostridiales bacterium]|nr:hypothetical protein [Clostridiales bacterium]